MTLKNGRKLIPIKEQLAPLLFLLMSKSVLFFLKESMPL